MFEVELEGGIEEEEGFAEEDWGDEAVAVPDDE